MPYPYKIPAHHHTVAVEIADISTAGQKYFPAPFAGRIKNVRSAINGAIATADADLTVKINGTAVTGGVITVAYSGSAAGDVDSATPTAANIFAVNDAIEVETDGASTNTVEVVVVFELEPI
jgi:hypothetical protein